MVEIAPENQDPLPKRVLARTVGEISNFGAAILLGRPVTYTRERFERPLEQFKGPARQLPGIAKGIIKDSGEWALTRTLDYIEPKVEAIRSAPSNQAVNSGELSAEDVIKIMLAHPNVDRDHAELIMATTEAGIHPKMIMQGNPVREDLIKAVNAHSKPHYSSD